MRLRVAQRVALPILMAALCGGASAGSGAGTGDKDKLSDLQARFDSETSGVHKAKMLQRLGDAEFEEADRAEKAGDYTTVDFMMEKYRDNVRAASQQLEKESPDGERHPNGYKQLEMHVQKGLREVDEILLISPPEFKPPLQLVRKDLLELDDELLRFLFPRRHEKAPAVVVPPGTQPGPEVQP
jgi:hypothetical protein